MSHKSTPEVVSSLSSPFTLPTQVAWAFPRVVSSLSPVLAQHPKLMPVSVCQPV